MLLARAALLALLALLACTGTSLAQGAWHQYSQSAGELFDQGDLENAERDCLLALGELPDNDPRRPLTLLQLGRIYKATGEQARASIELGNALELCRAQRPMNVDLYCDLLHEQAGCYRALGRPDKANLAEEQIGHIVPKPSINSVAGTPPEWKVLRQDLAVCYSSGNFAAAEPLLARYLSLMQASYGNDNPALVPVLRQYSEVLRAVGRKGEATMYYARAQQITSHAGQTTTVAQDSEDEPFAYFDKRLQLLAREEREREKREISRQAEEEKRIAAARQREYETQLVASREMEKQQLAMYREREKQVMEVSRSRSTLAPDVVSYWASIGGQGFASIPAGFGGSRSGKGSSSCSSVQRALGPGFTFRPAGISCMGARSSR